MSNLHSVLSNDMAVIGNDFNAVNCGGCGHFAFMLQRALLAHNVKSEVVAVQYCGTTAEDVEDLLISMDEQSYNDALLEYFTGSHEYHDVCWGHLVLKVDDTLYDCTGRTNYVAISGGVEPEVMRYALDHGTWNPSFLDNNEPQVLSSMFNRINLVLSALELA